MDNLGLSQAGNIALASGALAIATVTSGVKTTVIIPYIIDGVFKSKAITDNISIAYAGPTVYNNGAVAAVNGAFTGAVGGSTRLYNLYLDAAGTVSVEPGPIVNTADLAAGNSPLQFAGAKRQLACFGAVRVALTAGTTFIPGTTLLGAAGVTATYINLATVPAEPLLA